jgi:hypothetical protein
MAKLMPYEGYVIELNSYKLQAGGWVPRAWVIRNTGDELTMHPVYSKTETSPSEDAADVFALKLAKLWVDEDG